jgi:serine/threonine-protein kinase
LTHEATQRIGQYRLLDRLGGGGMGEVFVAKDETLDRTVALKAIRDELRQNPEARARFLREARVLSQLDHPGICTIHDYLRTDEGDYLVLEHIEGRSLREAMREGLASKTRTHVARQLVDVLVAAHGRGIVHRDLKPENIMLTPSGDVKVLDFGIARLLEDRSPEASSDLGAAGDERTPELDLMGADTLLVAPENAAAALQTRLGTVMGTAAYMSPEQAVGEPATPASDMYSLGLIFQELFTGQQAYAEGLSDLETLVHAASAETLPARGIDPDLARLIERLKSRAPGVRPSAVDVAERLRWVAAKPNRRRRRLAAVTTVAALAVVAVTLAIQSALVARERDRANREATTARQVSRFLEQLFEISDPREGLGEAVSARELLDRGARRVHSELEGQPAAQGRLLRSMGRAYHGLGLYTQADPLLKEASSLLAEARLHEERATTLIDRGHTLAELGALDEADRCFAAAGSLFAASDDAAKLATALDGRAGVLVRQGRYDEATVLLERALQLREDDPETSPVALASHRHNLGVVLTEQHQPDEARPYFEEALAVWKAELGANHPKVAACLINLASATEDPAHALELFREAEALWRSISGPQHPNVAACQYNIGHQLIELDRGEEAEAWFVKAQSLWEQALGESHPMVGRCCVALAKIEGDRRNLDAAERLHRRALQIFEASLGPDHQLLAGPLHGLAFIADARDQPETAARLLQRTIAVLEASLGPGYPRHVDHLTELASVLQQLGQLERAETLLRQAHELAAPGEQQKGVASQLSEVLDEQTRGQETSAPSSGTTEVS